MSSHSLSSRDRGSLQRDRSRSASRSPSPDIDLQRFLAQQARPASPESEAFRRQRIAAGGVSHVKSRRQRDKEDAERRKKEEEEDAARAYRDFVEDMQAGGSKGGGWETTGDKGDRQSRRSARSSTATFVRSGGSLYKPLAPSLADGQPPATTSMTGTRSASGFGEDDERDIDEKRDVPPSASRMTERELPGKRKSAMQDFLGELQRGQARREERLRSQVLDSTSAPSSFTKETHSFGPRDYHDPHSSNVCILNLPANVSEHSMGVYCSCYGDIASVKIMWPRTEEAYYSAATTNQTPVRTTRHDGATGFVNFMHRDDARIAYDEIDGSTWKGSLLHCGWGKSLPKPYIPLIPKSGRSRREHDEDSLAADRGYDSLCRESTRTRRKRRSTRSPESRNHRRPREKNDSPLVLLRAQVRAEQGEDIEQTIESVGARVKQYGKSFEEMVRDREKGNPRFSFLFDDESKQHQLYRSLIDDTYSLPIKQEPFADDGYASLYSSDSEEDSEWEKWHRHSHGHRPDELGMAACRRFDAMLRSLTLRRERIAQVMLFAIEHAHSADLITDRLIDSLLLSTTPLPRKLARLYTVSDVLHNSSAPASSAWRFRSLFETRLDSVFTHWGDVANSFAGRIKREACKDMARSLLNVWDAWLVFDSTRLAHWQSLVETGSSEAKQLAELAGAADHIDGEEMRDESPAELAQEMETQNGDDVEVYKGAGGKDSDGEDIDGEEM